MYIIAIAWLYVTVLMAATQDSVLAGIGTLFFYGIVPCVVVMYVVMAPTRARRKKALLAAQQAVLDPQTAQTAHTAQPTQTTSH